jgi:hypothetical protein
MSIGSQPCRPTKFQRYLAKLLTYDQARIPPPISLPGQPAHTHIPASATPPSPKVTLPPMLGGNSALRQRQPEPDDIIGAWPRDQYLRMDAAFTRAVERAFRNGTETTHAFSPPTTATRLTVNANEGGAHGRTADFARRNTPRTRPWEDD